MSVTSEVLEVLGEVYDPEVDRPVTEMGFIRSVTEDDIGIRIQMQLPQYFCAPNFTWLMADDVRRAAERVVGVGRVRVDIADHFESDRIGDGVSTGREFTGSFGAEAERDLDALRDRFRRKTFLIRQEQVCKEAEAAGVEADSLTVLELVDIGCLDLPSFGRYLTTREELGISCRHDDPFLVAADGCPVDPERLRVHRRSAQVMAVSFEGNGHLCSALLAERYPSIPILNQGEVA